VRSKKKEKKKRSRSGSPAASNNTSSWGRTSQKSRVIRRGCHCLEGGVPGVLIVAFLYFYTSSWGRGSRTNGGGKTTPPRASSRHKQPISTCFGNKPRLPSPSARTLGGGLTYTNHNSIIKPRHHRNAEERDNGGGGRSRASESHSWEAPDQPGGIE